MICHLCQVKFGCSSCRVADCSLAAATCVTNYQVLVQSGEYSSSKFSGRNIRAYHMCTSLNILLLLLLCSSPWSTMCFRPRLILPWNLPLFLQEVKEYVRTYRFPNDCIVVSAGPRVWHAVPWRGISTGPNRDPKLRVRRSLVKGWAARARAFCTHGLMTWFLWISWRNGLPWWLTVCVQFVFLFPGSLSYDESIFSLFSSRSPWWGWIRAWSWPHFHTERRWVGWRESNPPGRRRPGAVGMCLPLGTHPGLFSSVITQAFIAFDDDDDDGRNLADVYP